MEFVIKGAYLLIIRLERETILPKKFNFKIKPGLYAYAGNAFGNGGILSRCSRHFRIKKSKFWHIDWITDNPKSMEALAFPNQNECNLIHEILKIKKATIALNGFGNSDCKTCISHLIKLPNVFSKKLIKIPYLTLKLKSTSNYG